MIGRDEITDCSDATRVKIISEKRKSLDESVEKVRIEIIDCFKDIVNSLRTREKQLLRQVEAVHNQQLSIVQSNWDLVCAVPSITINLADECNDMKELIDKFGKIELSDNDSIVVKDAEPYRVEEYEDANNDHVSFDKSLTVNVKNDNGIIKLYDSTNSDENIINLTNFNGITIDSLPSNSSNSNFHTSLQEITDNLYMNSPAKSKVIIEKQNNNCTQLCSSLKNVYCHINKFKSHERLDTPNNSSNINLCSSKINNINDSINGIDNNELETSDTVDKLFNDDIYLNKSTEYINNDEKKNNDEHPKQIQQWLQQILVETETEPSMQEIEQFAEISKSRYRTFEFSLET